MTDSDAKGSSQQSSVRSPGRRAAAAVLVLAVLTGVVFVLEPGDYYLWAKALHVVAVISWMAGMLYLPRLFVYHADTEPGSVQSETFKMMEQRLLLVIINPAMMVTWVAGLWLAWSGFGFQANWLYLKFAAVVAMSAMHGYFSSAVRQFADDRNQKSARHWRFMNEVPTVLMVVIVILVVVKPF